MAIQVEALGLVVCGFSSSQWSYPRFQLQRFEAFRVLGLRGLDFGAGVDDELVFRTSEKILPLGVLTDCGIPEERGKAGAARLHDQSNSSSCPAAQRIQTPATLRPLLRPSEANDLPKAVPCKISLVSGRQLLILQTSMHMQHPWSTYRIVRQRSIM